MVSDVAGYLVIGDGNAVSSTAQSVAEFKRSIIQERAVPAFCGPVERGNSSAARRIPADLEKRILAALRAPARTEGVRKIAARFGVDPGTVQRISRPFGGGSGVAVA